MDEAAAQGLSRAIAGGTAPSWCVKLGGQHSPANQLAPTFLPRFVPRGVLVTALAGGLPSPAPAQDQFEGQVERAVAHLAEKV